MPRVRKVFFALSSWSGSMFGWRCSEFELKGDLEEPIMFQKVQTILKDFATF